LLSLITRLERFGQTPRSLKTCSRAFRDERPKEKAPEDAHDKPRPMQMPQNAPIFSSQFLSPRVSFALISSNWYQRKRNWETAYLQKDRMGPCRASGRMGLGVVSSNCNLGRSHPSEGPGLVLGVRVEVAVRVGAESGESVQGTGLARTQQGLDRRPYRLVHRTPVLYSRNQSRTNIVPCKEMTEEGRGKLAELLYMILERAWIVRGSYGSASRTTSPTTALSL